MKRIGERLMVGVLFVLVYWGHTGFFVALGLSIALDAAGAPLPVVAAALAVVFASFNLGLSVGLLGPPPGKRR